MLSSRLFFASQRHSGLNLFSPSLLANDARPNVFVAHSFLFIVPVFDSIQANMLTFTIPFVSEALGPHSLSMLVKY